MPHTVQINTIWFITSLYSTLEAAETDYFKVQDQTLN